MGNLNSNSLKQSLDNIKSGLTFIKHDQFSDVCVAVIGRCAVVIDSAKSCRTGLKVSGFWWNMCFVKSINIAETFNHIIPEDELHNWKWCRRDPDIDCIRYDSWIPLIDKKDASPS